MVMKVNFLKRKPVKSKFSLFSVVESKSCEANTLMSSLGKRRRDPLVSNLLEKISKLDAEISEKDVLFESIKKERMFVQEEMCNAVSDSDVSSHYRSSQMFLHLCSFENAGCEKDDEENIGNNKSSEQQTKKQKRNEKSGKNFVTRNIELAKQYSMAQFSLTDEEKIKLESLLSDIDSEEYSLEQFKTETRDRELKPTHKQTQREICEKDIFSTLDEDKDEQVNHFKLKKEEMSSMEDLDVKLHEILKLYNEEDRKVKQALLATNNNEDILQSADNEGKYWKYHQLQKRLESIEKDLANIAAKDAEEQKKLAKKNLQCFEDLVEHEEDDDDFAEKE